MPDTIPTDWLKISGEKMTARPRAVIASEAKQSRPGRSEAIPTRKMPRRDCFGGLAAASQ
jgi:hypothetical protein